MKIEVALSSLLLGLVLAATGARRAEAAVALIYHRFDDGRYPSTNISLVTFRRQLEWLAANRFEVWPASRLVEELKSGAALPDNVAVITIDDGYRSVLGAVTLLEEFQYPFSVFVSTREVDQRAPDLLDWDGLRGLCRRGAEILNHGADHDSMLARPGESDTARRQRILEQVEMAQERLEKELPVDCQQRIFSYPYGEFDFLAEDVLATAGFPAFGQQSGPIASWNGLQALPRFPVNQAFADSTLMTTKLLSLPFPAVLDRVDTVVIDNPPGLNLRMFQEIDRVTCFDGKGSPLDRDVGDKTYLFKAAAPLAQGRNRYNCTYPADDGRRFHWLSQFWFVP